MRATTLCVLWPTVDPAMSGDKDPAPPPGVPDKDPKWRILSQSEASSPIEDPLRVRTTPSDTAVDMGDVIDDSDGLRVGVSSDVVNGALVDVAIVNDGKGTPFFMRVTNSRGTSPSTTSHSRSASREGEGICDGEASGDSDGTGGADDLPRFVSHVEPSELHAEHIHSLQQRAAASRLEKHSSQQLPKDILFEEDVDLPHQLLQLLAVARSTAASSAEGLEFSGPPKDGAATTAVHGACSEAAAGAAAPLTVAAGDIEFPRLTYLPELDGLRAFAVGQNPTSAASAGHIAAETEYVPMLCHRQ